MAASESLTSIPLPTATCDALNDEAAKPQASSMEVLTRDMARGTERAWLEFHERYSRRLYRYLLVLNRGDEARAQDALQGTLTRVVRHIKPFADESVFWSWMTTIARNVHIDEVRRFARRDDFLRALRAEAGGVRAETDRHLIDILDRCLAALPEEERELVERKYVDGWAVREIADHLGASEKAVDSRLVRARRKLKQAILDLLKREN